MMAIPPVILSIRNVSIAYPISIGTVQAVDAASIDVMEGEVLGIVGESGCGKSTLGLSILKLLRPPGKITQGEIIFRGQNLLECNENEMRTLRGRKISMIFQNPLTSLDPVRTIQDHFNETIRAHEPRATRAECEKRAMAMLESLNIDTSRRREYPFQISGGMRQRIMIGLGLILSPELIIADEPTTALDVIVEAGFIELLAKLKDEYNLTVILISHNLGLVAEVAHRIVVMYAGRIMEVATTQEIFSSPLHPYTQGLLGCVPNIRLDHKELVAMPGSPPDLVGRKEGCPFAPRCPKAFAQCTRTPQLFEQQGHRVACWLYEGKK